MRKELQMLLFYVDRILVLISQSLSQNRTHLYRAPSMMHVLQANQLSYGKQKASDFSARKCLNRLPDKNKNRRKGRVEKEHGNSKLFIGRNYSTLRFAALIWFGIAVKQLHVVEHYIILNFCYRKHTPE